MSPEESHHLRKVLRLPMGGTIVASNGMGKVFLCVTGAHGDSVEVEAAESFRDEPAYPRLNLVLSLLKGRDLEDPVEGLCQLAVHAIHLVSTDHSQVFKGQDHGRLLERLRAKSLVALKQAKKPWLTEIHAPVPLRQWREKHPSMDLVLIHPGKDDLPNRPEGPYGLLTGPEGGFSEPEIAWLEKEKCFRMGLGATRIRGTHAPLIACGKIMGMGWLP